MPRNGFGESLSENQAAMKEYVWKATFHIERHRFKHVATIIGLSENQAALIYVDM